MMRETLLRVGGMVRIAALLALAATLVPLLSAPLSAPLAAQADEVILVVSNAASPDTPEVRLTEEELLALPQVTVRTNTEFTDGVVAYAGPLARDVVELVGAEEATSAHLVALNDYAVDIPLDDFYEYDVIMALHADGERLSRRDKGPIWIMYPVDEHAELQDPLYNVRMIWQLARMELR